MQYNSNIIIILLFRKQMKRYVYGCFIEWINLILFEKTKQNK